MSDVFVTSDSFESIITLRVIDVIAIFISPESLYVCVPALHCNDTKTKNSINTVRNIQLRRNHNLIYNIP
jgi:hypothetical protein